jgi:CDC-like kinase
VIRAVERYVESAKSEVQVLRYLASRDELGSIVRLRDAFALEENYCLVFERVFRNPP